MKYEDNGYTQLVRAGFRPTENKKDSKCQNI